MAARAATTAKADQLVGSGMLAANGGGGGGSVFGTTFGTDGGDGPTTVAGARGGPGSASTATPTVVASPAAQRR